MSYFDKSKFNVNMSGSEYLKYKRYRDSQPPLFTKKQLIGFIIIILSVATAYIFLNSIQDIFETPSTSITSKDRFLTSITSLADLTWNDIFKLFFITHIEIMGVVAILIGAGWAIHGFGFVIIRR